ncbi:MAG: hypothetical protein ACRDMJ_11155 [Solirubrobacteraceae bacterium]
MIILAVVLMIVVSTAMVSMLGWAIVSSADDLQVSEVQRADVATLPVVTSTAGQRQAA